MQLFSTLYKTENDVANQHLMKKSYCSPTVAHLRLVESFHFLYGFLGLSFEPSVVQVLVYVVDGPTHEQK